MGFGLGLTMQRPLGGGGGGPAPISILRGFNPFVDHGTYGHIFVDPATGNDLNSGSIGAPLRTPEAAMAKVTPGQIVKLRGGVYRGTFNFAGKGGTAGAYTEVSRYGTEQVTTDGAEPALGWTQCGAGDATVLGPVLGVDGSPVFKRLTPKVDIASGNPRAAFPSEDGVHLNPAMARIPDPSTPETEANTDDWLTATTTVKAPGLNYDGTVGAFTIGQVVTGATSGATGTIIAKTASQLVFWPQSGTFVDNETLTDPLGGNASANGTKYDVITGYRLPSLTSQFTAAQLQNAYILYYGGSNRSYRSKVLSFGNGTDGVANTINLTDMITPYNAGQVASDKFALINILPTLKAGEWGYTDDDATNCTIYIRPSNPANMAANIAISKRGQCVNFGGANYVKIAGMVCRGTASAGLDADGEYAINGGGTTPHTGLIIDNVSVIDTYRADEAYAPIWIGNYSNAVVDRWTVKRCKNQFGIFLQGGKWRDGNQANGNRVSRGVVESSDKGPFKFYGQFDFIMSFCSAYGCGLLSHANKFNFYEGCHKVLVYACAWIGCGGYGTNQEASCIAVMFCWIPVDYVNSAGRAYDDQNHTNPNDPDLALLARSYATSMGVNGDSYFLHNVLAPYKGALANTNSLTLGYDLDPAVLWSIKGNIVHGYSTLKPLYIKANGLRYNVTTSGATWGALSADTDVVMDPAAIFTDLNKGDMSFKADSPTRAALTGDISAEIAVLKGWFPDFTGFDYDMMGNPINHVAPKMGCYANPDQVMPADPIWIERPAITGASIVGQPLSVTDGYLASSPFHARSFQWVTSPDKITPTDVPGATGSTWTPAGDVGKYPGCRITLANGKSIVVYAQAAIISSYALGDPTVLATDQVSSGGTSTAKQRRILITASNKPLVVFVNQRNSTAADATVTIKIGAKDRTFGTGTDFGAPKGRTRRTTNDTLMFQLLAPGSGALEIQYESSDTTRGLAIIVVEQAGQTDLNLPTITGATTVTSRSLTETTDSANAGVFWLVSRFSGDPANPITMTGADVVLFNGNTGGTSTGDDLMVAIGYERAASIGAYAAAASWPTAATVTTLAMQVKS